tara:strand:+ start:164 stop:472 length:309 start_codon:yes stop_codon:yes gene_type:complete
VINVGNVLKKGVDMQEDVKLTGFIQGRVEIVVDQTYAKDFKAVGWINLQPVFSYQRPDEILQEVANLNKEKFSHFRFQLVMEAITMVDDYDTEFEEVNGEEE